MSFEPLHKIKRRPVDEVLKGLLSGSDAESKAAGQALLRDSASYGISVRDYLTLAVKASEGYTGYEESIAFLNLPFRNDFANGVTLQAASNTFQTYAGTRAMFPEVIDDMLRWSARQDQIEQVAPILANSRQIDGTELLSTVVEDDPDAYKTFQIPEGSRFPVRTLRTGQQSVRIWKFGGAIRTTYEFNRRVSLDILTPHARRIARESEMHKVGAVVDVLINGDGAYGAAPVVAQSSFDTATGQTAVDGKINWENFLYWLVQRAKAGTPVDRVVGNWDSYFRWLQMFNKPDANGGKTDAEKFAMSGGQMGTILPNLDLKVEFVVASDAPENKLIGLIQGETVEELKESGSDIAESERAILNQTMTSVRSENVGYHLVYGDTRSVYDYGN